MRLELLRCPHTYWQEARCTNGIIIAICRNKHCQQRGEFTTEEWNALGEYALNKVVRV